MKPSQTQTKPFQMIERQSELIKDLLEEREMIVEEYRIVTSYVNQLKEDHHNQTENLRSRLKSFEELEQGSNNVFYAQLVANVLLTVSTLVFMVMWLMGG